MSEGADPPALEAEELTRRFGGFVAVDHVNFAVPQGEFRAVIGPNGAGKTTLFNLLMNALEPSAGRVAYFGRDVTDMPEHERAHIGMARSFQSNQLFTEQTVFENVRIVAQTVELGPSKFDVFRVGRNVGRERTHEVLDLLGLTHLADRTAKNLSHGDQRLLGIAMALATDPEVLLLDEPTSGMGPGETEETADLIESIHQDLDLTLLLIEHDMDVVLSKSDRITVLHGGRVLATGTPDAIQGNQQVQEAYLGGMGEGF
jgi:branched-chain amino acid transport system ATP-binding protein